MANWILITGLVLLLAGSEVLMRGAVGMARQFDMSPLITGVAVVCVVTVMPELCVAVRAATMGRPAIAIGSLVGSNMINVLFVIGLGALIHPMASPPKVVFRDGGMFLLACLAVMAFAIHGGISRKGAVLLLAGFAAYVALVFVTDWRRTPDHSVPLARALFRSEGPIPSTTASLFLSVLGVILLALGAHLSVIGAVHFAALWGWTETTIALTIIAAGLSSPKLLLTLVAAARGQTSIAVSQLLGAGVFGFFGVLGLTALVRPLFFPRVMARADVYFLVATALALLPLLAMRWRLSRPRGILLMIAYGCYLAFLLWRQGLPLPWGL